jgi:adenylosuccinate lyase
MTALESEKSFRAVLEADPRVVDALSDEELDALTNPSTYVGLAESFVDRVLASVESRRRTD